MSDQHIKLLALDVDGVMTDGTILYTANGEEMKAFNAHDGLGIKYLRKSGVEVAVISGRRSAPLERRLDDLGVRRRRLKCADKTTALKDICDDMGITPADCAFMGDDWIDLDVLRNAGYAMAPSNAVAEVLAVADWVSVKAGGAGAVREACEHVAQRNGVRLVDLLNPEEYV
ncbi:KdsC family phosphatase [Kordiimonas aquimaris]|uniref:KdsC family phosphatase n=1 Tax=Kordiimonas aquimaris TaxID=707591 RepID=UPI0021CEF16B|nr:HAD-IIIA family hydrolase [Kordiimonas aquimaris]